MRKLIALAIVVAMAATAAPAFASVQNVRVSGDIDSTYLYRTNFDFGETVSGEEDEYQSLFITQTRLRVDADLTDQVSAAIALINERAWGVQSVVSTATDNGTNIALNLAYVTLREMLYSPLTVVVGRQVFSYGNGLIFDATGANGGSDAPADSGINNIADDLTKQTAHDAVRIILDYNPLKIEAFAAKHDANTVQADESDSGDDDADLFGVNATYNLGDDFDSVVEGYLFSKKDRVNHTAAGKADHIKVVGLRGSTNPMDGLNLQAEWAHQGGTYVDTANSLNRSRDAHIIQAIVNYKVPVMEEYKPMFNYTFTKATGDNDPATDNDETYTAWDPFYETQGGGTIYNALFNLTDIIIHTWSLTTNPMEDVTAKISYSNLFKQRDQRGTSFTLQQPGETSTNAVTAVADKNGLGQEVDLNLAYDYTEDVRLGLNVGWFFPGNVFDDVNSDTAKQALLNLSVAF